MRRTILAAALAVAMGATVAHAAGLDEVQAGNAAFAGGRYEAAVEAFTRGIAAGDLDPATLALALNNRGVAFNELGDFDAAIADYEQALRLRPDDPTTLKNLRIAYIGRGGAAANLGETEAALADYTKAVELDPKHPMALLRRGQLHLHEGRTTEALSDLKAAQALDPRNPDLGKLLELAEGATSPPSPQPAAAASPASRPEPAPQPPRVMTAAPPPPAPAIAAAPPVPPPEAAIEPAAGAEASDEPDERPVTAAREPAPSTPQADVSDPTPMLAPAAPASSEAASAPLYRAVADVNIRSGPGNEHSVSGTLVQGATVSVLGQRLGWLHIRLPSGQQGYVYRKWLSPAG